MVIYGLDFTSSPNKRKPITCAVGSLTRDLLAVEVVEELPSFAAFESFLDRPGPWRAGLDFPFGQPRRLLVELHRTGDWASSVSWLAARGREAFEELLRSYRASRPKRDKQHRRQTDELAGSRSPMMCYGVPVAKMFFEGAPRLLRSNISILPVLPRNDSRVGVEPYPKLVAARYAEGRAYKAEDKRRQNAVLTRTRERIVNGLETHAHRDFWFRLRLASIVREKAIANETGDVLDAVLCAVQAAWSIGQTSPPDGIPPDCDRLEGWIVDPVLLRSRV